VRSHKGTFAEQRDANLEIKCDLVERGLAHGVLVYDGRTPIGWCQFGPSSELPIPRKASTDPSARDYWRITCFCTIKEYREQGVAELALSAALAAIAEAGGGKVRAAPIVSLPHDPQLDDLIRAHGGRAKKVLARAKERYGATDVVAYDRRAWSVGGVTVHGLGPAWALVRKAPVVKHTGTIALFEKARFKGTELIPPTSRKLPSSRLVMERTVRAR
jgi:hypothetical protein